MQENYKYTVIGLVILSIVLGALAVIFAYYDCLVEATCFTIAYIASNLAVLLKVI